MFIKKIHIYGYGKLENYQLDFSRGVNVLYGENEAGKSTIFSFIHAMLFGFPQRNQAAPSYEPNGGVKYGGRLTVEWPEHGEMIVERVKNTQGTECKLYQDGKIIGSEIELQERLKGMDRGFYESIYSFNLDGIQEISRLNEEEIGRYLFFAGISGSERLWDLENGLQKQMDQLFKPSGKKPEINQKLAELKESSRQLQKARERENEYNQLMDRKEQLSKAIAEQRERLEQSKDRLVHLREWKRLLPNIQELSVINARLSELGEGHFPAGGIKRMDTIEAERLAKETLFQTQLSKLSALREERQNLAYEEQWVQMESDVHQMERILDHWEMHEEELRAKSIELKHMEARMYKLQEELHMNLGEERIASLDTSVFRKEEIKQLELEMRTLQKRKNELDSQFEQEKLKLEQLEKTLALYESKLLPDEERERLEKRHKAFQRSAGAGGEKETLAMLERLKSRREKLRGTERKALKKKKRGLNLAGIFVILVSILVIFTGKMLLGLGFGIAGILLIFLFRQFMESDMKASELDEEILYIEEKLAHSARSFDGQEDNGLDERLLLEDAQNRSQYEKELYRKERQNEIFEGLIQAFEKWEQEKQRCETRLIAIGDEWSLPQEISQSMLFEAFERLEDMKDIILEKNRIHASIDECNHLIQGYAAKLKNLANIFGVSTNQPKREIYSQIRQKLEAALLVKSESIRLDERIDDVKEEVGPLEEVCKQLMNEREKLLKEADCSSLTDFYQYGKEAEEREQLLAAKRQLMIQLGEFSEFERYLRTNAAELEERIGGEEDNSSSLERQIELGLKELAEVEYDIKRLEEDGTVESLQFSHQKLQEDFCDISRKWAKLAVAKGILQETIKKYKDERFPAILNQSNEYLRYLTNGKYEKMMFSNDGAGLMLQDDNGGFIHARDLSRGTAELAYVSIRLALAMTIEGRKDLPLMMDDTFVNFDDSRTERVLSLLKQIGQRNHQILFMTCHEKIKEHFTPQEVIRLVR